MLWACSWNVCPASELRWRWVQCLPVGYLRPCPKQECEQLLARTHQVRGRIHSRSSLHEVCERSGCCCSGIGAEDVLDSNQLPKSPTTALTDFGTELLLTASCSDVFRLQQVAEHDRCQRPSSMSLSIKLGGATKPAASRSRSSSGLQHIERTERHGHGM